MVLAAALLASGCTPTVQTHGYRPDPQALERIEPGRSTREQVLQLLGSPSSVATFDGATWYYITQRTERTSFYQEEIVAQNVVAVHFDREGVVSEIGFRGMEDAEEVTLVSRETPTSGNDLSMIEQFVGNIGRFNLPRDERQERRERR